MIKKSEKHSFLRNLSVDLSVDLSADASADALAIINIRFFISKVLLSLITDQRLCIVYTTYFGHKLGFTNAQRILGT